MNIYHMFLFIIRTKKQNKIDPTVVSAIKSMLDEHNPIVQSFRMAAERVQTQTNVEVKLCLIGRRSRDGRMYNLPTCGEVDALIVGMITYFNFLLTSLLFTSHVLSSFI